MNKSHRAGRWRRAAACVRYGDVEEETVREASATLVSRQASPVQLSTLDAALNKARLPIRHCVASRSPHSPLAQGHPPALGPHRGESA